MIFIRTEFIPPLQSAIHEEIVHLYIFGEFVVFPKCVPVQ